MQHVIVASQIVDLLKVEHGDRLHGLTNHADHVFPTRDLLFLNSDRFFTLAKPFFTRAIASSTCKSMYRSLKPFGNDVYILYFLERYRQRIKIKSFLAGMAVGTRPSTSEEELESLAVTISFETVVNASRAQSLALQMRDTGEEYHIQLLKYMDIGDRCVRIFVDASRTDQQGLNALSLAALDFGFRLQTINGILYANDAHLEEFLGRPPLFSDRQQLVI